MPQKAFITNSDAKNLKKRLHQLIEHSKELKFLVGFFYFSGWKELVQSLEEREDLIIKILVGLEVDYFLGQSMEMDLPADRLSNAEKADRLLESMKKALNAREMDVQEFYEQVAFFVELLEQDRLVIRKTADPNHAKLYLFNVKDELQGLVNQKFITGSSNLTRAGILEQNEFNVEISDYGTDQAENYFDELWETAVPITEHDDRKQYLINLINNQSQAAKITPFEAYVMVLKTYLDLMEQKKLKPSVEELLEKQGYINYQYQLDAVNQALTIMDIYNGAIIDDVVGLGKSIIAGMVDKHLGKRGMIICPPGLMGDENAQTGWKKYKHDFKLYDWKIWSSGKLEKAAEYVQNRGDDIEIIIIDEAHKYRNQDTENYEYLSAICRNRQVLLLTATPFSNSPADIFSLLKLFIVPGKSKITLDDNLESRFRHYDSLFRRLSYITKYHDSSDSKKRQRAEKYYLSIFDDLPVDIKKVRARSGRLSDEIRNVLEPILIRRNRLDLKTDPEYKKEISALSEPSDPEELFFQLSKNQSEFYDEVIKNYFGEEGRFKGAIYQPFMYEGERDLDDLDEEGNRQYQQQRNLYEFMRRLLVKRFESSFGSFYQSIQNFACVHRRVLTFIYKSGGRYILERNLIEKIYDDDAEEIDKALKEFEKKLEEEQHPKNERIYELYKFEYKEEFLADIKADLELMKEIRRRMDKLELRTNDPKAERLIEEVQDILNTPTKKGEPRRKVIIFSEYVDTVLHLVPWLRKTFQDKLLVVDGKLSATKANQLLSNFDASIPEENQHNQFQILLTSDKLSEGLNLNRAGAIINYDIPWNPTRVIQRVGRINRIGKKVFDELSIYNFFPTEKGSDIVKSRQTASHKMFLIHNTLGEDAKIFDADEEPSPSALFNRINQNPETDEQENLLTQVRKEFKSIKESNPSIIKRIDKFPNRVKTAKSFNKNQLLVYRQKGLGYFVQAVDGTQEDESEADLLSFQESLPFIKCKPDENRLALSKHFWPSYEMLKGHRTRFSDSQSAHSIEYKALNNLKAAIRYFKEELGDLLPFARMLVKDLRDYRTLSKFSLRRLANNEVAKKDLQSIRAFKDELRYVKSFLGENYLDELKERLGAVESEIIIAIENQKA